MKNMMKCPACSRSRKPSHEKRAGTPKAYNEKCVNYDKVDWKQWKKDEIAKAEKEAREKIEKAAAELAAKEAKEKADKEAAELEAKEKAAKEIALAAAPVETSNTPEVSTVVSEK